MAKQRRSSITIGDTFPAVYPRDFQGRASHMELREIWSVIGPTVEINMRNWRRPPELWELLATCYLQGLENGHSMATDGG